MFGDFCFIFFAIARSACLRVRSLGRNQHSALVACGLPLLFSPQVWHFVRQDADSTHENIDNIPRISILLKNREIILIYLFVSQLPVPPTCDCVRDRPTCDCAGSLKTSILRPSPAVCPCCLRLRYDTSFGKTLAQRSNILKVYNGY